MANHVSSLKRVRTEARRTEINRRNKTRLRNQIRAMRKALAAGVTSKDASGATSLLPTTFSIIDRSAKLGIIKKNTASRYKSNLHVRLKAIAA